MTTTATNAGVARAPSPFQGLRLMWPLARHGRRHFLTAAGQILVLDSGRISRRGTHDDLITDDGLYRKLWAECERASQGRLNARPVSRPDEVQPADSSA